MVVWRKDAGARAGAMATAVTAADLRMVEGAMATGAMGAAAQVVAGAMAN